MNFVTPLIVNEAPIRKQFDCSKIENRVQLKQLKRSHMRTRLSEAQNWKCCYCGHMMTEKRKAKLSSTIEHVVPLSKGGGWEWENLAAACADCNSSRGVLSYEAFMKIREERGGVIKAESRMQKKVRKYLKRAKQFRADGWKEVGYDEWLSSIRLTASYKTLLLNQLAECA